VTSLKKTVEDDASEESLLRIVHLLLQGMEQHAIEGDPEDTAAFRAGMQKLSNSLEGELTISELLVQSGSALQILEDYNRRAARYLKRSAGEWQAVVTMLLSAMTAMLPPGDEKTVRMREIAGRVRTTAEVEEVHKIRLQLAECITELHLDSRRQKTQESRVPTAKSAVPATAVQDTVTGLATRAQAETALTQAWQTEPPSYVAVMALDRLQIFNLRFGHSVGDEVLRYYSDFLRERLRPGDSIFRWSDGALLALLPRPNRLEIVRDEMARLMDIRCEHTVQTASRTMLLPINARWTVFPSMAAPRLLIHKIDAFAEMKAVKE
jgi:diguanylate cyclase (GGDEF)-like protein